MTTAERTTVIMFISIDLINCCWADATKYFPASPDAFTKNSRSVANTEEDSASRLLEDILGMTVPTMLLNNCHCLPLKNEIGFKGI